MKTGKCVNNMNGICSHGKHMNHMCVGKCEYFKECTKEMEDAWNNHKPVRIPCTMDEETEMQKKNFERKKSICKSLDELVLMVDQDELYEFDMYLKSLDIDKETYINVYEKAYHNCK